MGPFWKKFECASRNGCHVGYLHIWCPQESKGRLSFELKWAKYLPVFEITSPWSTECVAKMIQNARPILFSEWVFGEGNIYKPDWGRWQGNCWQRVGSFTRVWLSRWTATSGASTVKHKGVTRVNKLTWSCFAECLLILEMWFQICSTHRCLWRYCTIRCSGVWQVWPWGHFSWSSPPSGLQMAVSHSYILSSTGPILEEKGKSVLKYFRKVGIYRYLIIVCMIL